MKKKEQGMLRRLYIIIDDVGRQISMQNICAFASSAAFFIFISLMPMLVLLCTAIQITPLTEEYLTEFLFQVIPDAFHSLVQSLIKQAFNNSAGTITVSVLIMLWSAGNGSLALIRGFNAIYDVNEKRNYFVLRFQACIYTLFTLLMILSTLVLMVFGRSILNLIQMKIPSIHNWMGHIDLLRYLAGFILLILFLCLIYTFMPNKKLNLFYQLPGAVFAALLWSLFSWGYSLYLNRYGFGSVYGSLAILITMMFWMYFSIYIIMVGAYLNRYFSPMYYILFKKRPNRDIKRELFEQAKKKVNSIAEKEEKADEDYRFKMGQSVRPFAGSVQDGSKDSK